MTASARYAVYLVPPATHPLWLAANTWLGRDPAALRSTWGAAPLLRTEPWRYGFHATLKPPLRLAAGHTEADLLATLQQLAQQHAPFELPALQVDWLAGFLALRLVQAIAPEHPAQQLADAAVRLLDVHRAPHTEAELQRYLSPGLNAAQREHVHRWGYAHVFEHWRLHFTLTDRLDALPELERTGLRATAATHFAAALAVPCRIESLALFTEPSPGQPFVLSHRVPLGATPLQE